VREIVAPSKDGDEFIYGDIAGRPARVYQCGQRGAQRSSREMTMRWVAVVFILLYGVTAALADIQIEESRYVHGKTIIAGETAPDLTITLDNKYKTKSNDEGDFKFSVKYKPTTCMSDIKAGDEVYTAAIAGCYDSGASAINTPSKKGP
jgi:hypothetical protein